MAARWTDMSLESPVLYAAVTTGMQKHVWTHLRPRLCASLLQLLHLYTVWCRSVLRMRGPPSVTAKWPFHKDKCHSEKKELVINSKSAYGRDCHHLDIRRLFGWYSELWVNPAVDLPQ